jgi:hypothetical protein
MIALGLILLILMVLSGFISTFFFRPQKIEKKIDFLLINLETSNLDLPANLPKFLSSQLHTLSLTYPQELWFQDTGQIEMIIDPNLENDFRLIEPIKNKYNNYYEARLDLNSVQLLTGDTVIEPISENQRAYFIWKINPLASGNISGNLWFYMNIIDQSVNDQWRISRFALPIKMKVNNLLGLSLIHFRILLLSILVLLISIVMIIFRFSPVGNKKSR